MLGVEGDAVEAVHRLLEAFVLLLVRVSTGRFEDRIDRLKRDQVPIEVPPAPLGDDRGEHVEVKAPG
jgi:hypothetical protein